LDNLRKHNVAMIIILLFFAVSNSIICILIHKPAALAFSILGSTLFFVIVMSILVRFNLQTLTSYVYSIAINGIIFVYITVDKNAGDVLYLFVTIVMTTIYLNYKNNLLSGLLAMGIFLYSFFSLDLFDKQYELIFYYLFSMMCFLVILSYVSIYFSKTLQALYHTQEENEQHASYLEKNNEETKAQLQLLSDFSSELKKSVKEINDNAYQFFEQISESAATLDQQQVSIEEVAVHLQNIDEQSNTIQALSDAVRNRISSFGSSIEEYNQERNQLQSFIDELQSAFEKSRAVMDTVQAQMESVKKSTSRLDEITSQTHILSLNTAIESAKTKEPTFDVIAKELKMLTSHSEDSTKSIQENVQAMQTSIEATNSFINETSNFLEKVAAHHQTLTTLFQFFQETSYFTREETEKVFSRILVLKENIAEIYEKMKENQEGLSEHASGQEVMQTNFEEYKVYIDNIQHSFNQVESIFSKTRK